jgi:hypothetical protein
VLSTTRGAPALERIARALASPVGVLITLPLLVVAVGAAILLVGRSATHNATDIMARHQLSEQAISVQDDVAFALDQAGPLLARLAVLADSSRDTEDTLVRLHDLMIKRPGVAFVSISFPDGKFRGAYLGDHDRVEVQESTIGAHGTDLHRFTVEGSAIKPLRDEVTSYDPRQRDFYKQAVTAGARVWIDPYTFFKSHETGITCAEPAYDAQHNLRAVLTVDFDIKALSDYVARPALDQARSVVFTGDRAILAFPADEQVSVTAGTDKLVRAADLQDPALESLFAALGPNPATAGRADRDGAVRNVRDLDLSARDGAYLASIAPIGGSRAGVRVPLDWYVATVVPERTLIGPTREFERASAAASVIALVIAVLLALVFAWNLVRMRRAVATSREQARTAEARAAELGSYRLVAKLGIGGMGEVWRAEHRLLARQAAIKLIRPEVLHDPASVGEVQERFRREAQTLASMKSRHTIAIYDYGVTADDVLYYVMELLDGLDLESIVVKFGAQPAPRVIAMMIQACASLAEAHDAGLLHRDIKPPNLFACRAADEVDIIKLLDFGIVQAVNESPADASSMAMTPTGSRLTQMGAILGTPGFMPPEQILGLPLDGRADLYALGCCAWWLLTGGELFSREDGDALLMRKHMHEAPPPLAGLVDGWVPPELEAVLRACLAKDLDERPRDARALADMLRAIPIPPERAWTRARAVSWWQAYRAPVAPAVRPSEVQIIMPVR